jgi:putative addiction module component (TIGR02574 family)
MAQSLPLADLRDAVLALPLRDRMTLVRELQENVEADPEWAAEWRGELRRRVAETAADPSKRIPWSAVRVELAGMLSQKP